MLKINPNTCRAVLFDMDGVITKTTTLHASAWKSTFDEVLKEHFGDSFQPFNQDDDYRQYVDGKPRLEGVRSFLNYRDLKLNEGSPDDKPGLNSFWSIANLKNQKFLELLDQRGAVLYDSTIELVKSLKRHDIKIAVVSASENCVDILTAANVFHLFEAKVDGKDTLQLGLEGKPHPDVFLEAASRLNVKANQAIVVEDAKSGVQAGHAGGFLLVIGVARDNNKELLLNNGANFVVSDLSEISVT